MRGRSGHWLGKAGAAVLGALSLTGVGLASVGPAGAADTSRYSVPQLKRALLSRTDLGSSWTLQPPDTAGISKATGCPDLDVDLNATSQPHTPSAVVTFAAGTRGPFLSEQLVVLPAGIRARQLALAKAGIRACHSVTLTSAGEPITFGLSPASFGAKAAGARLVGRLGGSPISAYVAIEDIGSAELDYFYIQFGSASAHVAGGLFTKGVAKGQKVLDA